MRPRLPSWIKSASGMPPVVEGRGHRRRDVFSTNSSRRFAASRIRPLEPAAEIRARVGVAPSPTTSRCWRACSRVPRSSRTTASMRNDHRARSFAAASFACTASFLAGLGILERAWSCATSSAHLMSFRKRRAAFRGLALSSRYRHVRHRRARTAASSSALRYLRPLRELALVFRRSTVLRQPTEIRGRMIVGPASIGFTDTAWPRLSSLATDADAARRREPSRRYAPAWWTCSRSRRPARNGCSATKPGRVVVMVWLLRFLIRR